jgi:hypothetical protein
LRIIARRTQITGAARQRTPQFGCAHQRRKIRKQCDNTAEVRGRK